jgi:hypothetical protein
MSSGDDRDASVNGGSDADPFELGNRHAERGEIARAEEAYRRADEDGHGTAAAYAGLFSEARGDFDEARDATGEPTSAATGSVRCAWDSCRLRTAIGTPPKTRTHARRSAATNHRRSIPQACAPGAPRARTSRRRWPTGARHSPTPC